MTSRRLCLLSSWHLFIVNSNLSVINLQTVSWGCCSCSAPWASSSSRSRLRGAGGAEATWDTDPDGETGLGDIARVKVTSGLTGDIGTEVTNMRRRVRLTNWGLAAMSSVGEWVRGRGEGDTIRTPGPTPARRQWWRPPPSTGSRPGPGTPS